MYLLIFASVTVSAEEFVFFGNALDPKTQALLYKEVHTQTLNELGVPTSETVEYIGPNGEPLGLKKLEYTELAIPNYKASYFTTAINEEVIRFENTISVNRNQLKTINIPKGEFTIDGGFHYFILNNFDSLKQGNTVKFEFLSASRASFIPMKATAKLTQNRLNVQLRLSNPLLSKLLKPIELVYQTESKRLLSYAGITNVPNAQGKAYKATIEYFYAKDVALKP
jgi:hypothetical protein